VVIVGGSLAGLRAAEAVRSEGHTGRLTVIGDEPHEPYDRPPLSKAVLAGRLAADSTALPTPAELDAEWLLGTPAAGLDLAARHVALADGRRVEWDRLLVATGTRAREWPDAAVPGPAGRSTDASGWDALTPRELQVVELVTLGATNQQAARRLHVSPHTVNAHLRHVFAKLGVSSRVELTRVAVARERG
jgi:NADPH-dependent 2,4-dienoyl-CoA reductase/sulfur reductase-like enzyme